ncbi:protocatechuate 3,4-dioxygenase [Sinomonas sp. R1AF57]|uniref:protocatechuate 3,4-dioxygenase n=1 Tax=Sinomonas sp. R1AF57 TaxID=2020377 RepID=UPI000B61C764|nr:protocatechuate 3,4-dioxygenase [Sinomonas sp. R1AF57]ASN53380.1 protocatechuate 3,4-dioxygenase [Sinomonas sp. R1AF57]
MGETDRITFSDIPGTYVFDGRRSRQGLALNLMSAALNDEAERAAFRADEEAFMERFRLTEAQRDAVRRRDWARMVELGGNIYFVVKIAIGDGKHVPEVVAAMTGQTVEEYTTMMKEGGRNPRG